MDGWMGGWMDGSKSCFKDYLQQSIIHFSGMQKSKEKQSNNKKCIIVK
jgi:hypothetical protein